MTTDIIRMKKNTCLIKVKPDQVKFWQDQGFAIVEPAPLPHSPPATTSTIRPITTPQEN